MKRSSCASIRSTKCRLPKTSSTSGRRSKDVSSYNKAFQAIILDIPDITVSEVIDSYSSGLKSDIWEVLCLNHYDTLEAIMLDALKVEAAKRGTRRITTPGEKGTRDDGPVLMDLSNIQLAKLTLEERKRCMREGPCLRCRSKSHMAKACPKAKGNSGRRQHRRLPWFSMYRPPFKDPSLDS